MTKIHDIAIKIVAGMPVWVWALVIAIGVFNEYINRTKKTEAQSILQGTARFILGIPGIGSFIAKAPIVGWLLTKIATPPDASAPTQLPLPLPESSDR